jgi:ethanolamine transporter
MLGLFDGMTPKGMIFNAAFCVGGAFTFGDHLAYLGSVQPEMIIPVIIGKLAAGIVSIVLCILSADFLSRKGQEAIARESPRPMLPFVSWGTDRDNIGGDWEIGPE